MKVFEISVRSDFAGWDKYNVFLTAVCTVGGEVTDYVNANGGEGDTPGQSEAPVGVAPGPTLITPPCESADVYLYVVAREFPASAAIAASPPFDVELVVNGEATVYKANQFGGLSVKQRIG